MSDLFSVLGGPLVFFYSIAIIASLLLFIQLLLTAFGFDDVDVADDLDYGANIVSFRSLTGFFGGLGWTGVIMLENGYSLGASTLAGVVVGLLFMATFAYLMRLLYSLREKGNVDLNNAVGKTGTVYVSVPPSQTGTGQVRVMVQGRLQVIDAYTESEERIPSDSRVRIREVVDSTTFMVDPLDARTDKEP